MLYKTFRAKNLALHQFESRNNICEKLHLKYRNKTMAIVHISALYMHETSCITSFKSESTFLCLYNFKWFLIAILTFMFLWYWPENKTLTPTLNLLHFYLKKSCSRQFISNGKNTKLRCWRILIRNLRSLYKICACNWSKSITWFRSICH